MNGPELIVSEGNDYERRQGRSMQELFPRREARLSLSWRWRDVGSSCDRAGGLAKPILNLPKTSGRSLMAMDARHEFLVQLPSKPDAKRKFLEARDSMLKSYDVIANFARILWTSIHDRSRFNSEQFT